MKKNRKILSILLVVMLLLSFITSVNAELFPGYSITINNAKTGHTYSAYQVFAGVLSADKTTLSNIVWGNGVNGDELLTELKTKTEYSTCTDAEAVSVVLGGLQSDSAALDEFAEIVSKHLNEANKVDSTKTGEKYVISGLSNGYYFIKDTLNSADKNDAYSKYILRVSKDEEIEVKSSIPAVIKQIIVDEPNVVPFNSASIGDTTEYKSVYAVPFNSASIGDTIEYYLRSYVPEMEGYKTYQFTIKDVLGKGLTFNENSLNVTIEGTELTKGTDYTVSKVPGANDTTVEISFTNFINRKAQAGNEITVTYNATLGADAELGKVANTNSATVIYSNNPYAEGTGESQTSSTYTYSTSIEIFKVDAKDAAKALTGAEFEITTPDGTKKTVTANGEGKLILSGLEAGNYTIKETKEPDGYNLLKQPIVLSVVCNKPTDGSTECTWAATITSNPNNSSVQVNAAGLVELTVPNTSGLILPTTGGAGTVIFIVAGISLMAIAGIVLVTKNKNNKNQK